MPPDREIVFGRDPECHVRFGESDDLVSRKHLKIVQIDGPPVRYKVVDLGSRNGTFVNRQRVFGAVVLLPGGRVQLGAGGPEFELLPDEKVRAKWAFRKRVVRPDGKGPRRHSKNARLASILLVFGLLAAAGFAAYPRVAPVVRRWRAARQQRIVKPSFNAAAAAASVASIDAEWALVDRQTGARLEQAYIANERISRDDRLPLVDGGPAMLPTFVMTEDRQIEPLLVPAGTPPGTGAVGGSWKSKGLIVSRTGAVLTAVPRVHPWDMPRRWRPQETAGALLVIESQTISNVVPLSAAQFPLWTPNESGFFAGQAPGNLKDTLNGRRLRHEDLRLEFHASIQAAGRSWKTTLVGDSSPIWMAPPQPGVALPNIPPSSLDTGTGSPSIHRPIWVAADEIESGELQDPTSDGLLAVRASGCADGGVVFDDEGRVLALCLPNGEPTAGVAVAAPIRRGLLLLNGVIDGFSR